VHPKRTPQSQIGASSSKIDQAFHRHPQSSSISLGHLVVTRCPWINPCLTSGSRHAVSVRTSRAATNWCRSMSADGREVFVRPGHFQSCEVKKLQGRDALVDAFRGERTLPVGAAGTGGWRRSPVVRGYVESSGRTPRCVGRWARDRAVACLRCRRRGHKSFVVMGITNHSLQGDLVPVLNRPTPAVPYQRLARPGVASRRGRRPHQDSGAETMPSATGGSLADQGVRPTNARPSGLRSCGRVDLADEGSTWLSPRAPATACWREHLAPRGARVRSWSEDG
jgi:hypothetical protein